MNIQLLETDKAWLAGFVDGEGYIGIVRVRKKPGPWNSDTFLYHPWVIVTNTQPNIIDYIQTVVSTQKRAFLGHTGDRKHGYQAKITKFDDVIEFLEALLPYLKLKQEQAKLLIQFCKLRKNAKVISGRGHRGRSSFGTVEENIYLKLRELNKRGT